MADGDSITQGAGAATGANSYPTQALAPILCCNTLTNVAASGNTSQDIINHLAASVTPTLTTWQADATRYVGVYTLMIGANDIRTGVADATLYANIQSICSTVTGVGAKIKMVVLTILPSSFTTPTGTFETHRQAVNTLIRTGGACAYSISDVGNDPTIGQAGQNLDLTYYQDGTHPTVAGNAVIASVYLPTLHSLGVQ